MVLKNKEIEKLLLKMTPTVPSKEVQKTKNINKEAKEEAENIDTDTPEYNKAIDDDDEVVLEDFEDEEDEDDKGYVGVPVTEKDDEIEKQKEILRKLKLDKFNESQKNKRKVEQAQRNVSDVESEKVIIETIDKLHNNGLFRTEILFQMQNLNVNLVNITSQIERLVKRLETGS